MRGFRLLIALGLLVAVICAVIGVVALRSGPGPTEVAPIALEKPTFVGRTVCATCHEKEEAAWRGSHHDLAMQEPTPETVLGDFDHASFTYHEVTTTFFREGEEYRVRTDGPDGALQEYRVAWTFGVDPLQQYIIEFPGGRYQALNVCWDARPAEEGGQRWFHLYPEENVTADDILHWTGPYQNWNHMCAECHSTAVHKGYDAATGTFATRFTEIDVSCEACHGPGSGHVAWAHRAAKAPRGRSDPAAATLGFVAALGEPEPGVWYPDPETGIASRDVPRVSRVAEETCARCHARRGTFDEEVLPGRSPSDTHRLALLERGLYRDDGQILDEVYEYQSFLQSRMHAAGVTCTDCHDPHSLEVAPGNAACARCHEPARFDVPEHYFHEPGGPGSLCVECHMPTRTYMVVHDRHDHSLRVPRPDLTTSIGTPNACNGCHADRSAEWAAAEIASRLPGTSRRPHFGEAFAAARNGRSGADVELAAIARDAAQPSIVRATAVGMLGGSREQGPIVAALGDADPLVRAAAVGAIDAADATELARLLAPLLRDPVRLVRIDAGRRLAALPDAALTEEQRRDRDRAVAEFVAAQQLDADRAEAWLNLGALATELRRYEEAERHYREAIRLSPRFPAGYVNLGDLYRMLGREEEALRVLRDGAERAPGSADLPYALGLALVRSGRLGEAIPELARASALAPEVARFAYVHGVALESLGPPGAGIEVLEAALERHPWDPDLLAALVAYCRGAGRLEDAIDHARRLAALQPDDPERRGMVEQLEAERAAIGGRR